MCGTSSDYKSAIKGLANPATIIHPSLSADRQSAEFSTGKTAAERVDRETQAQYDRLYGPQKEGGSRVIPNPDNQKRRRISAGKDNMAQRPTLLGMNDDV